jgi:hypothetical protein
LCDREVKSENFESSKPLPREVLVISAGTHLNRIGLSHFPYGWKKRKRFHYPLLIALLLVIIFAKCVISFMASEENQKLLIVQFDFSHFLNARIHMNICVSFLIILTLVSQILHYINNKKDIISEAV